MMTSEQCKTFEALWREAFAKGLVRWMPGMRYIFGNHKHRISDDAVAGGSTMDNACYPDPNDPATVGCILAMAREVVDDPGLHVEWCDGDGWTCWLLFESSATEPEALLRAILEGGGAR